MNEPSPLTSVTRFSLTTALAIIAMAVLAGFFLNGYFTYITKKNIELSLLQNAVSLKQVLQITSALQTQAHQQQTMTQENLAALQQQVSILSGDNKGWVLAEVDYLVQLANLQLRINRNVYTAMTLLQTADQRLASLHQGQLTEIRHALISDLHELQNTPQLDKEGLLLKLHALSEQISKLSIVPQKISILNTEASPTDVTRLEKILTLWKKAWDSTVQALQQIVIVHRRDQIIIPLLAPDEEVLLRQNLVLLLQQAQWAVLNNEPLIYKPSLQRTIDWLKRYFPDNHITQSLLADLAQLQTVDVNPTLPTLTKTFAAIHKARQITEATSPTPSRGGLTT